MSKRIMLLLTVLLLNSHSLLAWNVVPLLSYSTTSGVLLGGVVNHNMLPPFSPFGFSTMTYVYTDGSFFSEPQFIFPAGSGLLRFSTIYSTSGERDFYGWGNRGDDDSTATYSEGVLRTSLVYVSNPLRSMFLSGGIEVRHSSAYDRDHDDALWDSGPLGNEYDRKGYYGSVWTAGPLLNARWMLPAGIHGYLEGEIGVQTGGNATYYENRAAIALFAPIGASTLSGFRIRLDRHVNSSSTPFSFLPLLGGSSGLRGYGDGRFMGSWSLLLNAELRQRLFGIEHEGENLLDVSLVIFGDAGQVSDHMNEFAWDRFHLDGGIGARLSVPGGGVLRADFALSPEGLGVQMGVGELF